MKLALAEVYEVATFYAHFDVVKEGPPPPPVTVRVCENLSCAMAGAEKLLTDLPGKLGSGVVCCARPAWVLAIVRQLRGRPRAGDRRDTGQGGDGGQSRHARDPWRGARISLPIRPMAATNCCRRASTPRTRDDIVKAVSDARLRGLGGAGFRPAANGRWCAPSQPHG